MTGRDPESPVPVTTPGDETRPAVPPDGTAVMAPASSPASATTPAPGPRVEHDRGSRSRRLLIEWVVLIAVALAIAFLIKTFLFQAFYIPSESMTPTLQVGDRVLVNKLSYDFHDVNRGDIVVFEAPPAARSGGIEDLVKRAIGLPGETVTADASGTVLINGRRLSEPYLPAGTRTVFSDVAPGCGAPADGSPGCVVPKGHVFVMGDNRSASKDARVFGPIEDSSIVGRVFLRIWPPGDAGFF